MAAWLHFGQTKIRQKPLAKFRKNRKTWDAQFVKTLFHHVDMKCPCYEIQ